MKPQENARGCRPLTPELLILNHHLSNRVFDFSSERFGVLLFPLSRCCGASTAVAAKKCEPTQGQRPSGHRRRSNRKRQQKWRVFLCVARAVVLSRACNEVGHGAARARFLAAFARSKAVPPEAGAFMTCATRMSSTRQKIFSAKAAIQSHISTAGIAAFDVNILWIVPTQNHCQRNP